MEKTKFWRRKIHSSRKSLPFITMTEISVVRIEIFVDNRNPKRQFFTFDKRGILCYFNNIMISDRKRRRNVFSLFYYQKLFFHYLCISFIFLYLLEPYVVNSIRFNYNKNSTNLKKWGLLYEKTKLCYLDINLRGLSLFRLPDDTERRFFYLCAFQQEASEEKIRGQILF